MTTKMIEVVELVIDVDGVDMMDILKRNNYFDGVSIWSLAHMAIRKDALKCFKWLVTNFPEVVAERDHVGDTLVIWAAYIDKEEAIKILIEAGADSTTTNHRDRDALYYATDKGNHGCVRVLRDHMAIRPKEPKEDRSKEPKEDRSIAERLNRIEKAIALIADHLSISRSKKSADSSSNNGW